MTIEETSALADKIKMYRPYFGGHLDKKGYKSLVREWNRVLEEYDFQDIDRQLDEFLSNGDNMDKLPDVYQLRKYCVKSRDKTENKVFLQCTHCGKWKRQENWEHHMNRCRSVMYLRILYTRYFQKEIDIEPLYKMSQEEFDEKYYTSMKLAYPLMQNDKDSLFDEKESTKRVLEMMEKI